uniref:Uncharacterized protein n=1 Tax=Timema tahoe TaxID=61484 RepID=A0A7R9IUU4_9NEOP|nr:unnamed protein product [Timema tahoe]
MPGAGGTTHLAYQGASTPAGEVRPPGGLCH